MRPASVRVSADAFGWLVIGLTLLYLAGHVGAAVLR